jgi:orotidine-5'-phosphate decarboxylase
MGNRLMVGTGLAPSRSDRQPLSAMERLIVALDVATADEALRLVDRLGDTVSFYKIGLHLQLVPELHSIVANLRRRGKQIFLDFKYIDIPATVASAVRAAAELGISFITVIGQAQIVRAAVAAREDAELKILAVTLLTGMSEEDMQTEYRTSLTLTEFVKLRAIEADRSRCGGVIASPNEIGLIRSAVRSEDFLVVTPGIRPAGVAQDDQKRTATPYEAILRGADYLVVGRPILRANQPGDAARRIIDEIARALEYRNKTARTVAAG